MALRTRRLPSVSIRMTMLAIGLAAANFWAIKSVTVGPPAWWAYLAIGSLPTASVLLLILVAMIGDLRRKREASPFAFGFLVSGGFSLAAVSVILADYDLVNETIQTWIISPILAILAAAGIDPNRKGMQQGIAYVLIVGFVETVFLLPHLILGVIGGITAKRLGLRLIRTPSPRDGTGRPPSLG